MKELFKNIKDTLSQLFGFKEVKEVKEWKQCLEGLEKNGYFTAEQLEAFKEADLTTANLVKSLEDEESKTKGKSTKGRQNKSVKQETNPQKLQSQSKNKERTEQPNPKKGIDLEHE